VKLARLNHILIAPTRDGRERFRRSFAGRLLRPVAKLYEALSSEGRGLLMVMLFVGAAALEVATTKVYILWVALVGLLLGSLVLRLAFAFDKVRLEAKAPARVALGQTIILSLTLHNARSVTITPFAYGARSCPGMAAGRRLCPPCRCCQLESRYGWRRALDSSTEVSTSWICSALPWWCR